MFRQHLSKAIPVIASLNINRTVSLYRRQLKFDKLEYKDQHYTVMAANQIEIHFWKCNNKIHSENTSCYSVVNDIDILYDEIKTAGASH